MNVTEIVEFLHNRQGYRKEGKQRLHKILLKRGHITSVDDCAEALRLVNSNKKEFEVTPCSKQSIGKTVPNGFEVKSMWQGANGKMLYSYKKVATVEDNDNLKEAVEILKKHNSHREVSLTGQDITSGITKVHVVADIHIGALVKDLKNTLDYSIEIATNRLKQIAEEINSQSNSLNHVCILGDLIESFQGANHPDSWKEMESGAYGGNVLILAYEMILGFLESIDNLGNIYMLAGNHDRTSNSREIDTEGDVCKIISYFLKTKLDNVFYDKFIISEVIDGINYLFTHGHKGFMKGDLADLILSYGKGNSFKVLVSGHLHTRQKKERFTFIEKDTSKYRGYICPSVFTGNSYSEGEGYSSTAGFYTFSNKNGLPKVEDIPLI